MKPKGDEDCGRMTYKGTVKGNIVILESSATLPEGSEVEVRLLESKPNLAKRKEVVARLAALRKRLEGRDVNLSRYIVEAREYD